LKKIIVTPAGRKEYLSVLVRYLDFYKSEFDEWHLWCNTNNTGDIEYMNFLEKEYSFIKIIPLGIPFVNDCFACTISYFIENDSADENSAYLRLDDDIVFIQKNSIKNIFEFRLNHPEHFLCFGNIVNNSVMSHIHQQLGILPETFGKAEFNVWSDVGLKSNEFAEFSHRNFFNKFANDQLYDYNFRQFFLDQYTHVSIQVISWLGSEYKKFNGKIPDKIHEEYYQSTIRPKELGMPNVIFGNSLFCHFSSQFTRDYLSKTDVMKNYERIADEYLR
jgi:hypothetical protein